MKKKKKMMISGALIVFAIAGVFVYRAVASNRTEDVTSTQTATVQRGTISSKLSSSGSSRSAQNSQINWETSGKVSEVNVGPGDPVAEGDVLAALDGTSLSAEIVRAKQDLIEAQNNLDDLLNSDIQRAEALQAVEDAQKAVNNLTNTTATDLSAAQLALVEAQEAYADALNNRTKMDYPHSSDELVIDNAETEYLLAKQVYKEALKEFNRVADKKQTNPERVRALEQLLAAEQKMEAALATYNWYILGYSTEDVAQDDAELAVAKANLGQVTAEYDRLASGGSSASVMMAEAELEDAQREWKRVKDGPTQEDVDAAEAAVEAAQAVLDNVQLLAPFEGTITDVDISVGDLVSAGDAGFRIDDLSTILIDLSVSEVDLPSLEVGQPAIIVFDAISDQEYEGEVVEIGMVAISSQGVVNYPITVQVTNPDENIIAGMSASVDIVIAQSENVLLVPSRAVRTTGGQQTVTVLYDGQHISVPVTVGLTDGTNNEVTSDQLREGDIVVINGTTSTTNSSSGSPGNLRQNFQQDFGGAMPGGMMVPGGGMP